MNYNKYRQSKITTNNNDNNENSYVYKTNI